MVYPPFTCTVVYLVHFSVHQLRPCGPNRAPSLWPITLQWTGRGNPFRCATHCTAHCRLHRLHTTHCTVRWGCGVNGFLTFQNPFMYGLAIATLGGVKVLPLSGRLATTLPRCLDSASPWPWIHSVWAVVGVLLLG